MAPTLIGRYNSNRLQNESFSDFRSTLVSICNYDVGQLHPNYDILVLHFRGSGRCQRDTYGLSGNWKEYRYGARVTRDLRHGADEHAED